MENGNLFIEKRGSILDFSRLVSRGSQNTARKEKMSVGECFQMYVCANRKSTTSHWQPPFLWNPLGNFLSSLVLILLNCASYSTFMHDYWGGGNAHNKWFAAYSFGIHCRTLIASMYCNQFLSRTNKQLTTLILISFWGQVRAKYFLSLRIPKVLQQNWFIVKWLRQ